MTHKEIPGDEIILSRSTRRVVTLKITDDGVVFKVWLRSVLNSALPWYASPDTGIALTKDEMAIALDTLTTNVKR